MDQKKNRRMIPTGHVWYDPSEVDGVVWVTHTQHQDQRGSFTEAFRASTGRNREIVQVNVSISNPGVLRGMHWHDYQTDYWYVADGRGQVIVFDLDTGRTDHAILKSGQGVVISPGIAHGFLALEGFILIYGVTKEFDAEKPDEHGFYPFSILAKLSWTLPRGQIVLSERDELAPQYTVPIEDLSARFHGVPP